MKSHKKIKDFDSQNTNENETELLGEHKTQMMNILNCFVHFYLFQSLGETYLFDMIRFLITSFTECDIEILIFALHNIGLQLRKKDPESLKNILDLFN